MSFIDLDANIAFIHVPKTGGSSIEASWTKQANRRMVRTSAHDSAWYLADRWPELWRPCYKVAVVRNPWDWWVSVYHWYRFCEFYPSFREFLLHRRDWWQSSWFSITAQWLFLCDRAETKVIIDHAARFEDLQAEYDAITTIAGLPQRTLPHKKPTQHCPYWCYYDSELEFIVAEMSRRDIELFSYTFPSEKRDAYYDRLRSGNVAEPSETD